MNIEVPPSFKSVVSYRVIMKCSLSPTRGHQNLPPLQSSSAPPLANEAAASQKSRRRYQPDMNERDMHATMKIQYFPGMDRAGVSTSTGEIMLSCG